MSYSTGSDTIAQMYADIVQDLVPYYLDKTLLQNSAIIRMQLNVEGQGGGQIRIPVADAPVAAATVTEGTSILAVSNSDLTPVAANITFAKRGSASDVTQEAVEDGLFQHVVGATLDRLSGVLATGTDSAGTALMKTSFTNNDGVTGANAAFTQSFIMSPSAMAFGSARSPVVNTWYNPNYDLHEFRATTRNGFAVLDSRFGRTIKSNALGGSQAEANVTAIATSVANLRSVNAPVGADGNYVGVIDAGLELAINKQIAGLGGSTVGALSDIGNNALRNAFASILAGCTLYRSNLLPDAS
tara:strand:- start:3402 stop:4301 length:900 start_codon:yes stop_codon:yes gene_type:complete